MPRLMGYPEEWISWIIYSTFTLLGLVYVSVSGSIFAGPIFCLLPLVEELVTVLHIYQTIFSFRILLDLI